MKKLFVMIAGVVFGVLLATVAQAGRNSGGTFTYTAPGGPVAATGQTISSAWANTSLTEIQSALTDSLSRSGLGGMSAPLKLVDGTAAAPGINFSSSANTGLYYTAGPTFNVGAGGVNALACTASGCTVPGTFEVTNDVTFSSAASVGGALTASGAVTLDGTDPITIGANGVLARIVQADGLLDILAPSGALRIMGPTSGARFGVEDPGAPLDSRQLFISTASTYFTPNLVLGGIDTPGGANDAANKQYVDDFRIPAATRTWTTLAVSGSNCAAGSPAPAYTVLDGVVYFRGAITHTSPTASTACSLAAVAVGARPAATRVIGLVVTAGTVSSEAAHTASISTLGVLSIGATETATVTWRLDNVIYPAEG